MLYVCIFSLKLFLFMAPFHIKNAYSTKNQHFPWSTPFSKKKSNYPNFWLTDWGLVTIDLDNWSSTVPTFKKSKRNSEKIPKYVILKTFVWTEKLRKLLIIIEFCTTFKDIFDHFFKKFRGKCIDKHDRLHQNVLNKIK